MKEAFDHGPPPREAREETIEELLEQIEAALKHTLDGEEGALRLLESRAAEMGLTLDQWMEAVADAVALGAPEGLVGPRLVHSLTARMAADPPRSLTAQTGHGGIALTGLVPD